MVSCNLRRFDRAKGEKKIKGPPPQSSLPAVPQAILDYLSRLPLHCQHDAPMPALLQAVQTVATGLACVVLVNRDWPRKAVRMRRGSVRPGHSHSRQQRYCISVALAKGISEAVGRMRGIVVIDFTQISCSSSTSASARMMLMISGWPRSLKVTHGARCTPVRFAPISQCERLPPIFKWAISLGCVTGDG